MAITESVIALALGSILIVLLIPYVVKRVHSCAKGTLSCILVLVAIALIVVGIHGLSQGEEPTTLSTRTSDSGEPTSLLRGFLNSVEQKVTGAATSHVP